MYFFREAFGAQRWIEGVILRLAKKLIVGNGFCLVCAAVYARAALEEEIAWPLKISSQDLNLSTFHLTSTAYR
jgi:hypothetical protein